MDIEKLNKSQIVLLTLLVSFMTSIATGIVTVSLMEQAPPAITETVNRVVERTVERVVTGQVASVSASDVVPAKTVVVKEADLIPQALQIVSPSVVRIYSTASTTPEFLGLGLVLDSSGTIATDQSISKDTDVVIELSGSMRVRGVISSRNESTGVAFISAATSTNTGPIAWKPAKFFSEEAILGQSVIMVSGKSATRVGQGIITAISPVSDGIKDAVSVIETDIAEGGILPGSPIIDSSGSVVGISTSVSRASDRSGFITGISMRSEMKEKGQSTQ